MTATNIGVLYVMMMIVDTTGETVAIQFYKGEKYDNQQIPETKKLQMLSRVCAVVAMKAISSLGSLVARQL